MQLINDDCLKAMAKLPNKSIDLILTDPPYGTTQCKWDSIIPFEPMWKELKRIIKDNGCIVLFGTEPFSSYLRLSNIKWFKYDWIWQKNNTTGFSLAKKQPMRNHEIISVFYKKHPIYNFIKEFKNKTGVPILLNTSFNDREPIVETPQDAIKCFKGTDIDYLYFYDHNILVKK